MFLQFLQSGPTYSQGPKHVQILHRSMRRCCCRLPHTTAVPYFKFTSPPHALFKQVCLKLLPEVRPEVLQTDWKCHVVVLKLYDVARGIAAWCNSENYHELLVLNTRYSLKFVRLFPEYSQSCQTVHVPSWWEQVIYGSFWGFLSPSNSQTNLSHAPGESLERLDDLWLYLLLW